MTRKGAIFEEVAVAKTTTYHYTSQQGRRRQGLGTRVWLVVTDTADYRLDEVSKHQIMRRTGLPARDLRALDPVLSYPSSILGRERAIVVNLEHIKAIITATQVLMLNSSNPLVVDFVDDLRHRILGVSSSSQQAQDSSDNQYMEERGKNNNAWSTPSSDHHEAPTQSLSNRKTKGLGRAIGALSSAIKGSLGKKHVSLNDQSSLDHSSSGGPSALPFEFRALEACLESACKCLESETRTLEQEAYPALDELTSQISTLNLERNSDAYTCVKPNIEELEMLLEAYFAQVDVERVRWDTEDYLNIMLDDKQNQLLQMGVMLSTANMIANAGIAVVGVFGMNIHITLFDGENRQFWAAALGTVGSCIVLYLLALGWGRKRIH
ncbi:Magnesium transporter MRS2-F [Bienertia sinuspersici]